MMMGKCRKTDWINGNFYQSEAYNQRANFKYLAWIMKLAINRFRWEGLPDTCDESTLERALLQNGVAAICTPKNMPGVWFTLPVAKQGRLNIYGLPTSWVCVGKNGDTFESDWEHGALVYNSQARLDIWNSILLYARKLAHYDRTEDINLSVQKTPWLLTAPDEKKRDLVNLFNQIAIGEVAVLGNEQLLEGMGIEAINLQVPFIGDALGASKRVLWAEVFQLLGIPNLPFEKGERMIREEATGNETPTNIMFLDAIQPRRKALDHLRTLGLDASVVFNRDNESYNYNYMADEERQAELQDEQANDA